MQIVARKPKKITPRSDFRPEEFRKLIFGRGLRVAWEQCSQCPCLRKAAEFDMGTGLAALFDQGGVSTHTAEARSDCAVCSGKGYFYHSSQDIRAIVTRASENPDRFRSYGEFAKGTISVSLLPEHLPSFMDRFTLKDSVLVYREAKTRTANAVERLRYPIYIRELDLEAGPAEVGVLYAHRAALDGTTTANDILTPGADFVVTPAGEVDWTLGDAALTAPVENARYTISYYANPRYIVTEHPYGFRDTWVSTGQIGAGSAGGVVEENLTFEPLPVSVECRLEFLGDGNG